MMTTSAIMVPTSSQTDTLLTIGVRGTAELHYAATVHSDHGANAERSQFSPSERFPAIITESIIKSWTRRRRLLMTRP